MAYEDEEDERGGWFAQSARMVRAHEVVRSRGLIAPLDVNDAAAVRLWQDMDLAIMIECCYGVPCDPRELARDDAARGAWLRLLGDAHEVPSFRRLEYARPYWLLREGRQVGTVDLGTVPRGPELMPLTSLYVLPEHRRMGVAGALMRTVYEAALQCRCNGLWLDTYWVWQGNVDYYLKRRFWIYMWKRELTFFWARYLPTGYEYEIDAEHARFRIIEEGVGVDFYEARRSGDLLVLAPSARARAALDARDYSLLSAAESTFALALARAGWPLYQREESKARHWLGDGGNTEGLAPRIQWYEALARHRGWVVATPRVPGIDYQSYAELTRDDEPWPPEASEGGGAEAP